MTAVDSPQITAMPRIRNHAPEFTATTTQGPISFPQDYAGKWVIFFSYPADFTPVCTSEFMTFASMQEEFHDYNCELVGLSIDGLHSHIARLRTIKERITFRDMKDVEVTFRLIDDVSMAVARQYAMIMPNEDSTKAVRAVFIIDPAGVIRTIVDYPLSTGRIPELLRVVKALQTADTFAIATAADWRPGEPVIVPPAGSCGTAMERMQPATSGTIRCEDWFFCQQDLDEDAIDSAIRAGGR